MNTKNTDNSQPLVSIEKLLNGGDGLARHEGQAIFVPLTAPGDQVRVRITKQSKNFSQAVIEEIVQPGPDRHDAPCPHYGQCGGCNLQHMTTEGQHRAKAEIVAECFQRLGKLDVADLLTGPAAIGRDLGYRNRIRLFASPMGPYGLMRRGSNEVVPLDSCPLLTDRFNQDILPWLRMMPPMEQIVIRLDDQGNWLLGAFGPPARLKVMRKIMAGLAEGEAPAPGCTGILFNNRPVWGHDYLIHRLADHKFRVGALSFFQANHQVTEHAVATARQWIGELAEQGSLGVLLGDLFCGVGLFSLTLADLFEKVVAVDSDESAIRDARNNVERDPAARGKVSVHLGEVAEVLNEADLAPATLWRDSLCLADPPRTGLGAEGVQALLKLAPRHVLFMSCDPATLARDAALLNEAGYRPAKLEVLDMFPQTSHIETLMLMTRNDQDGNLA
jgi:23S rRNA (uracil1939-C5)-methyltransferase